MDTDLSASIGDVQDSPAPFTRVGGMLRPVPAHLRASLAPVAWIVHEWTEYVLSYPGATHLRIGSRVMTPSVTSGDGVSHFRVRFENELGLAAIQPFRHGSSIEEPLHFEVIAKKFPGAEDSLAFMGGILADLFSRGKALPFNLAATTGRGVRDATREPNDLFAYHFFRHHHAELARAIQAVLGSPHRVLSDRAELVRIHEVKRIDGESILHMLRTAGRHHDRAISGGTSALHRLQPERVLQRIPEETFDTPENRFILSAARRMHASVIRIQRAPWYRNDSSPVPAHHRQHIDDVHHHLRQLVTDRRFADLDPAAGIPAQSRVLQRKDGYRELTLLWDTFHRVQEPVYARMERAIDLRDVATLYELWLLFELIDALSRQTGIRPVLTGFDGSDFTGKTLTASFPGVGKLFYQRGFKAPNVYSGISLFPDFVWETSGKARIVMDAKFRISYPWSPEGEGEKTHDAGFATSDDITKMHAYRDAIRGVTAAIVLYPGANGYLSAPDGTRTPIDSLDDIIDRIITGDLEGIGAIPMTPIKTH